MRKSQIRRLEWKRNDKTKALTGQMRFPKTLAPPQAASASFNLAAR
jgi:hypothetical protein